MPTDLQTDPNSKQLQHRTTANTPRRSPEQKKPTEGCTGQLGMNSTRGSTPPNRSLDLPIHSTDLNKTLGILGTPHEESITKFNPTKTRSKRRNRRNPAKNTSNHRTRKTPKSSPFTHGFGRGITAKEPRRVPTNFPHQISKRKVPKTTQRNRQERVPKITTKDNWKQHIQTLTNHAESSIHATKVLTRSSLPPDHPTLSQDLTMKLSS
jgi:hypothetical protein